MIGGISFSATSITSGLDADKPVSPRPGQQYLATDTKILYACYVAGTWVDTTNTVSGLDANKPANPRPGNQYLATDTKILYVCYVAGTWVNATPPLPKIAIVETANDPSGTSTEIFYKELRYAVLTNRPNDCNQTPSYTFTIQADFTAYLQFFTRGYDGTGAGTTEHRLCVNGVSTYYYTSNHRNGVINTAIHEFKKGDIVTIIATSTANDSGIQADLSIKCKPILNIDGVKFNPVSIDQSAFLLMV